VVLKLIPKESFDNVLSIEGNKFEKLGLYADMCRYNTLTAVKKAGSGHLGSSFSAMDIVVHLYLNELNILDKGINSNDRDIYFSSKGHDVPGLYSLFYALGLIPQEKLLKLRRLNGLDGHPDVRIPGIEANSGSLGMGISKGRGMAWAKKYNNYDGRVYVLTGDGEFQEGQIWESLQATAHQKVSNLTVIIDRNKFQTDMLVDEVNRIEDLFEKVHSFGWYVVKFNGHDFIQLEEIFNNLKYISDKPKFVIADTIKGKGVSFMEEPIIGSNGKQLYRWHSGAPDDEHYEKAANELSSKINGLAAKLGIGGIKYIEIPYQSSIQASHKEYVINAYGETLVELAKERDDLIVLDGDLSADCRLRDFEYEYPERFIENGIAEQDMVSMAGGLAKMGLLPVVNTFGSFLAARANEQIYNNACENTKIIYTCHFSGMIPAGPGKSHQSVRDISLFGALPNCVIVQPCNSNETKMAMHYFVKDETLNCVLRLAIGPSPRNIELPGSYKFEKGKGARLFDGDDGVIFAYGPVMLHEALLAAEILESDSFGLRVINMPWLNRVDEEWLIGETSNIDRIFVLEDHSTIGGLGDFLLKSLVNNIDMNGRQFEIFGLDEYPECGTPSEVLGYHKLDGKSLAERISGTIYEHKNESDYSEEAPQ
jgi:transketolase